MTTYSKKPSAVPPPPQENTAPHKARASTVPNASHTEEDTLPNTTPRPSTVHVPPCPTPHAVTEASVTQPMLYRLSPSELACPDYEKNLLLTLNLNHSHSIRAIGRSEEETYRHIAHWIANTELQEREEFSHLSENLTRLAEAWHHPRTRSRLLDGQPLNDYLRQYRQKISSLQTKLAQQDRAFAETNATLQANHHTLERLIAALQYAHALFAAKLPSHEQKRLSPLVERCTVLTTLMNDTLLQQSQLELHRQEIQRELDGCDRILTFLITQIEQLSVQTALSSQRDDENFFTKIKEFLSR